MRKQDLIAQQAFSSLQLGRISFSAALMRPAVAAFLSCAPETGHTERRCWCNMMQTSMAPCPELSQDKPVTCLRRLQPEGSVPQRHRLPLWRGGKGPNAGGIPRTWDADGKTPHSWKEMFTSANGLQRCESDISAGYFTYILSLQVTYGIKIIIIAY